MAQHREPIIRKGAGGPSVPLQSDSPLSLAQYDSCHQIFNDFKVWDFSAGKVQGTYPIFTAVKDMWVFSVSAVVQTAFTAAVTLTIGDGDSAAGFLASADIAPQTINTESTSLNAAEAYANGKYYAAGDTIDLVIGVADTLVGQLAVRVEYMEMGRFEVSTL